jgi:urease accessory protein
MRPHTTRLLRRSAFALGVFALLPTRASAHSSIAGFGSFGSGFLHPLVDPALLLAVVVSALLIGQHGFAGSRPAMAAVAAGLAAGLIATGLGHTATTHSPLLIAVMAAGLLVGVGRRWPPVVYGLVAAALGLGIGLGAEPDSATGAARTYTLLGSFIGGCIWIADGAVLVLALKKPWGRVLVRVVASWMAACALLVLALNWAPARVPLKTPVSPATSAPAQPLV